MPTVHVNIPGRASYDVLIEPGLLKQVGRLTRQLHPGGKKAAVITDKRVASLYLPVVEQALGSAGFTPIVATIEGGEQHKNLQTIGDIFDVLLPAKIDRQTPVIALGGGIVGDVAGFVAGTLLRGVPLIQIPTTLLAMVDASVGGKTGVNHAAGKNLIGVFHQAELVVIDPQALKSLGPSELRDGLAECIKHQIIRDAEGFAELEQMLPRALTRDLEFLTGHIARNVAVKARVVEVDPLEHGPRAHLNFGHTFGHAIEKVSDHAYSHGQAVALGMTAATRLAGELKMLDADSQARIIRLIAAAGLPTGGMKLDVDSVVEAMSFDKKVAGSTIRLILPDRIGNAVIRGDVDTALIRQAVQSLGG